MEWFLRRSQTLRFLAASAVFSTAIHVCAYGQGAPAAAPQVTRAVGTIKNIGGDSLTLAADSGDEVTATLTSSTKILRVPPGETDLKNATPLQSQDLQTGDRVLVRGHAADGHSIAALSVIVMKQADVSAKHAHERDDWQKRGVGGLVSAVDATAGTITISTSGLSGNHNITIHTTKDTVARRYAPGSVRFDAARPAPLDQIKPGDQLRARGTRSADGNEVTAEEIVSGAFRNIAGTITAIDPASNSMTVQDAIGKSSVVIKVSADSQMKKLPAEMAQRIAMRLKGGTEDAAGNGERVPRPVEAGSATGAGSPGGPGGMQAGGNGSSDLQRVLSRIPSSKLSDLQKGDAVMLVATRGDSSAVTAITLLAGVEPILTAAPNRSAAILSPWTLGGSGGEGETAP